MRNLRDGPLRAEMIAEAEANLPTLRRCPNTSAIRVCDYFNDLSRPDRLRLTDALIELWLIQSDNTNETIEAGIEFAGSHPLLAPYLKAVEFRGFGGGWRATPVKLLAGIAKDKAVGGVEGWIGQMGFAGRDLIVPKELASGPDQLFPVRPGHLRKLVASSMRTQFGALETKLDSQIVRFAGPAQAREIVVDVEYARGGPGSPTQLKYHVFLKRGGEPGIGPLAYESFWRIPALWNYITEANAERSADLLADLIRRIAALG